MVRKTMVLFVIAAVAPPGGGAEPQPVTLLYKRANPPLVSAFNVHGGRYSVEVEMTKPIFSVFDSRFTDDGMGKGGEVFEFTGYEPQKELRIEDGKLTVNGQDRGTVASGDRIKMTARGKVLVNDTER